MFHRKVGGGNMYLYGVSATQHSLSSCNCSRWKCQTTNTRNGFDNFLRSYMENGFDLKIYHVPSVGDGALGGAFNGELLPPDVKRPPGRPKKICILSRGEFKRSGRKGGRRCTTCRRQGHNKASCRQTNEVTLSKWS
ncbi:unnamed protein product [Microthlaspi erraticum]|uniref:CCHC-type domain-containing protein n=1 Tax=Microthlaspi erraticum TaxID=1685480 RepID=A0A6D2I118_9BRAS|nr:unnamed protein product [Microthlaspi erraticum]